MSTTTQQQITELQNKINAAQTEATVSTEADRARLEELQEQAAKDAASENQRRAARRIAWARHYLEGGEHSRQASQARRNVTTTRQEFETILAEQPWVKALLGWQAAINEEHAVRRRMTHARNLLGVPATEPTPAVNVLPMRDSEVSFTPLGRVLHYLAEDVEQADPDSEVNDLAAATEGDSDPLAEAIAATGITESDPLAYLARDGSQLDLARHETDKGLMTMHRNPNTDEWVMTDAAGRVKSTSWQQAKAAGAPSNPIDGRQFGSILDPESNTFVKTRVN